MSELRDRLFSLVRWAYEDGLRQGNWGDYTGAAAEEKINAIMRGVEADRARLVNALKKYGEHRAACPVGERTGTDCTCGLDAALASVDVGGGRYQAASEILQRAEKAEAKK